MFGIGTGELLLILVLALIVLGPDRMPKIARDLGRVMGDLRRASDELRDEFLNADKVLDRAASSAAPAALAQPATSENGLPSPAAAGPEGETPFDREMREARERLRAQQPE